MAEITREAIGPSDLHFLLQLTIAGQVYLFCSRPDAVLLKQDGTAIQFAGGMSGISWRQSSGLGSTSAPLVSVPIQVLAPKVDWALIEADGHDIAAGSAELSKWIEGTVWEARKVLALGAIDRPQFDALGLPLSFALVSHPFEDRSLLPPAAAVVDAESWPYAGEEVLGRIYVTVVGEPGPVGAEMWPGSVGLLVDPASGTVLISDQDVAAVSVHYRYDDETSWTRRWPSSAQDGRGRVVSTITTAAFERWTTEASFSTTSRIGVSLGADEGDTTNAFYSGFYGVFDSSTATAALQGVRFRVTAWNAAAGTMGRAHVEQLDGSVLPAVVADGDICFVRQASRGQVAICWTEGGGIYDRTRSGALRSAGDVLEHFFGQFTTPVARGRVAAEKVLLRGLKLDFFYDTPRSAWEIVSRALLPFLPVTIRSGPAGVYFVAWDFEAEAGPAVHIDVDRHQAERIGPMQKTTTLLGELANDFRVSFCRDALTGDYRRQITLHGDPDVDTTGQVFTNRICRISHALYGKASKVYKVDCTFDGTTAGAIAAAKARMHALPTTKVAMLVRARDGLTLREGAAVRVTDTTVHLAERWGLLVSIQDRDDGSALLELLLFHRAA